MQTAKRLILALTIFAIATGSAMAATAKPLKNVLPDEALVIVWAPNPATLVDSINNFTPGPQADIPPLSAIPDFQVLGNNWDSSPAAFVLMPGDVTMIPMVIFSVKADSIANLEEQSVNGTAFGNFAGYVAAIPNDAGSFEDIVTTAAYQPSPEAAKLMEESPLFVHVNLKGFSQLAAEQLKKADGNAIAAAPFPQGDGSQASLVDLLGEEKANKIIADGRGLIINLLDEFISCDSGVSFDFEGMKFESVCEVAKEGLVSRYIVSNSTKNKLEPALPLLDNYVMGIWAHCSEQFVKTMEADTNAIAEYILTALEGTGEKTQAIVAQVKKTQAGLELNRKFMGPNTSAVFSSSGGKLSFVGAYDLLQSTTREDLLDQLAKQMENSPQEKYNYQFEKDYTTIQGEKISRLILTAKDDENSPEAMGLNLIFGSKEVSILYAFANGCMIASLPDDNMEAALNVIKGKPDAEALTDDDQVTSTIDKVGADNDFICLFALPRFIEMGGAIMARQNNMAGNAPMPLPFVTPAAIGMKFEDGYKIRTKGVIPTATISETISAAMGFAMMMQAQ